MLVLTNDYYHETTQDAKVFSKISPNKSTKTKVEALLYKAKDKILTLKSICQTPSI